jgi:hypothetical protein
MFMASIASKSSTENISNIAFLYDIHGEYTKHSRYYQLRMILDKLKLVMFIPIMEFPVIQETWMLAIDTAPYFLSV